MPRPSDTVNVMKQIGIVATMLALLAASLTADPTLGGTESHELAGMASWYGGKFQGRLTANGEIFDTNLLTAAHKTLPFGTLVEVVHQRNGSSVTVRINDRGPFVAGRIIDLSRAAAEALSMTGEGVARVALKVVGVPDQPVWTIQIASFGVRGNAVALVNRLATVPINADIEDTANNLSRVVVMGVPDVELNDLRVKLSAAGYPNVLVRSERPE